MSNYDKTKSILSNLKDERNMGKILTRPKLFPFLQKRKNTTLIG